MHGLIIIRPIARRVEEISVLASLRLRLLANN